MEKEKVVLLLDVAAIDEAASERGYRLDYYDLLSYVSEGRFLVEAYAYVPINPRNEHRSDRAVEVLWQTGYIVNVKRGRIAGGTYRCNFAVEMVMDVLRIVQQARPDILVLVTGNEDFLPLIQELRRSGVRVEIAAFEEMVSAEMQLKCSGFIDLAVYYENALVLQREARSEDRMEERYKKLIQSQEQQAPHEKEEEDEEAALLEDQQEEEEAALLENREEEEDAALLEDQEAALLESQKEEEDARFLEGQKDEETSGSIVEDEMKIDVVDESHV